MEKASYMWNMDEALMSWIFDEAANRGNGPEISSLLELLKEIENGVMWSSVCRNWNRLGPIYLSQKTISL